MTSRVAFSVGLRLCSAKRKRSPPHSEVLDLEHSSKFVRSYAICKQCSPAAATVASPHQGDLRLSGFCHHRALVTRLKPATEEFLQISDRVCYPLCH
ncbi:hypothetical protein PoB_007432400 [Plakobranchus ocellatus]|uniref:Uncharacterized protein n=1 Tax=Plakobranchus ocellatus TaxID=259542 RepID=A0AAV4DUY2_9GAST|nr:hypothetical protein PoB_007432400 [Plakobranchus ocellatus]